MSTEPSLSAVHPSDLLDAAATAERLGFTRGALQVARARREIRLDPVRATRSPSFFRREDVDATAAQRLPRVYLAGRIGKNDWRHDIVPALRGAWMGTCAGEPDAPAPFSRRRPGFRYTGPFFVSDDHGCFHGDNTHGALTADDAASTHHDRVRVDCLAALRRSTHVFAWLGGADAEQAHGTLVEIGYALALGLNIIIGVDNHTPDDLWFATGAAPTVHADNPVDAFMLARLEWTI